MSPHCAADPATATHSCAGRGDPCPPPVVLDGFGPEALGTGWAEGWYATCGDAYGGPVRYHHPRTTTTPPIRAPSPPTTSPRGSGRAADSSRSTTHR